MAYVLQQAYVASNWITQVNSLCFINYPFIEAIVNPPFLELVFAKYSNASFFIVKIPIEHSQELNIRHVITKAIIINMDECQDGLKDMIKNKDDLKSLVNCICDYLKYELI